MKIVLESFQTWLKLGCLAYGFCEDEEYKKKTLDFTIYTGLELDAVKSGVRPKINEGNYKKIKNDNPFLQMKDGQSMGKILYYKDLDKKVRETKTEMDVSTERTNDIEKESIKRALRSMPQDLQSAILLLPYYVKEENKKINKSDKAEKQKNSETYIFDRLYKEIKEEAKSNVLDEKDDVEANKENASSEKISKVKMVCDAIACLQKGLSGQINMFHLQIDVVNLCMKIMDLLMKLVKFYISNIVLKSLKKS